MRAIAMRRAQLQDYGPDKGKHDSEKGVHGLGITEKGRLQAVSVGLHLARNQIELNTIYSGTHDRHIETMEVISNTYRTASNFEPDVRRFEPIDDLSFTKEHGLEAWERGLSQTEWLQEWIDGKLSSHETRSEIRERIRGAKEEIMDAHSEDATVLMVSSTIPVLMLVEEATKMPIEEMEVLVNNTGIFEFEWRPDHSQALQLNATPHLPRGLRTREFNVHDKSTVSHSIC